MIREHAIERSLKVLLAAKRSKQARTLRIRLGAERARRSIELGQQLELLQTVKPPTALGESEFRVFSQFGEDGVIAWITSALGIRNGVFVEVGVEAYQECNTRYLASRTRNPWSGAAIDGDTQHVSALRWLPGRWQLDVNPVQAFVTAENINEVVTESVQGRPVDLLSIDIDGVDYWIWKAYTASRPSVVVIEFNALFGPEARVTVPYQSNFKQADKVSGVYYGASLAALAHLGYEKGYTFVGSTTTGVNAFFVRDDVAPLLGWQALPGEVWRDPRYASVRNSDGDLLAIRDREKKLLLAAELNLFDLDSNELRTVRDCLVK
jgi:hypothetical protein